ncbi:MAG: prepilin-type N-terminal cleavage/methylation domain-containing protein [Patescibacteria group bacterium]
MKMKNVKIKIQKYFSSGFTLMEVVVVMFIFTLAAVIIAEIFINVQRAQQRTRDLQTAFTDARYVLEVIAKEIRSGFINYSEYTVQGEEVAQNSNLYITTSQGNSLYFRKAPVAECRGTVDCIQLSKNDGVEWFDLTTPTLRVDTLEFFVTPLEDPFPTEVTATTPDIQPQVTIVLKTSSTNIKIAEQKPTYLQTTVTARVYAR